MVHEQSMLIGDSLLEAQLVAGNASTCSSEVLGDALQMSGSATISVPVLPPLSAGLPAGVRLQSESTH
jgi:hypothetical protein